MISRILEYFADPARPGPLVGRGASAGSFPTIQRTGELRGASAVEQAPTGYEATVRRLETQVEPLGPLHDLEVET